MSFNLTRPANGARRRLIRPIGGLAALSGEQRLLVDGFGAGAGAADAAADAAAVAAADAAAVVAASAALQILARCNRVSILIISDRCHEMAQTLTLRIPTHSTLTYAHNKSPSPTSCMNITPHASNYTNKYKMLVYATDFILLRYKNAHRSSYITYLEKKYCHV